MVSDGTQKKGCICIVKTVWGLYNVEQGRRGGTADVGEFKFFFFHVKILLEQRNSNKKKRTSVAIMKSHAES